MAHCLAVGADGADILGLKPRLGQQCQGGGGKFLRHSIVGHPHAVYLVLPRGAEGVELAGRCLWPGVAERRLHPKGVTIHSDQHRIDPIHAGTRHQSDIALAHDMPFCDEKPDQGVEEGAASIPCQALVPDINPI
ncbi:hypothetical protein D3C71_1698590 [compost metagenome]